MSETTREPSVIVYDVRGEGPMPEGSYVTEVAYLAIVSERDAAVRRSDKLEKRLFKQGTVIASLKRQMDSRSESTEREVSTDAEGVLREYHLGYNDSRGHVFDVDGMAEGFADCRARLAACEKIVEAAKAYEKWMGKWHDYTKTTGDVPHKVEAALINAVRAAVAAETHTNPKATP